MDSLSNENIKNCIEDNNNIQISSSISFMESDTNDNINQINIQSYENEKPKCFTSDIMSLKEKTNLEFFEKLFGVLNEPMYNDFICWTENGKSFIVKNKEAVTHLILQKFFQIFKYDAFVDILRYYAFEQNKRSNNEEIFFHAYFQRNKPELLCEIDRIIKAAVRPPKIIDKAETMNEDIACLHREIAKIIEENEVATEYLKEIENKYIDLKNIVDTTWELVTKQNKNASREDNTKIDRTKQRRTVGPL